MLIKPLGWLRQRSDALLAKASPVARWCLDYPSSDRGACFTPAGRVVQGWLLLKPKMSCAISSARVICELQPTFELCCSLNVKRPDVVASMLNETASNHPQLLCGFRFTVPPNLAKFRLLLELEGQRWLLREVSVEPSESAGDTLKVLEGKAGWLFLDNDSNFSIDQFIGQLVLTSEGIKEWAVYAQALKQSYKGLRTPVVLLVAPAKETVMAEYHPYTAAETSILQPVFDLLPPEQLVYPAQALYAALGDNAFFKTDTHWTHQGASLAAALVAKRLHLAAEQVDLVLDDDRYIKRNHGGDLGNKLTPRVIAPALFLASFNYRKWLVYDNGLPNFGRIIVTYYPQALEDATCLVFGSSSSYSMFNYYCRFFKRLVFIHTAGNLDPKVIEAVAPDYLVAQTNARFMIRPPKTNYCLQQIIIEKQSSLDLAEFERQKKNRNLTGMKHLIELGLLPWHQEQSSIDAN